MLVGISKSDQNIDMAMESVENLPTHLVSKNVKNHDTVGM